MASAAISPARLAANRNNAKKSTGPKTEAGKQRSSRNSITHGCYALKTDVIPGEDPAVLEATILVAIRDLHPVGIVETALVESAMRARWRARRAARFETAVLNQEIEAIAAEGATPDRYVAATAYRRLVENSSVLQNLDRAEMHASNEMHRSLRRLTELKAQRLKFAEAIAKGIDPTKDPYDELFKDIESKGRPPGVEPIIGLDDDLSGSAFGAWQDEAMEQPSSCSLPSTTPSQNEAKPAPEPTRQNEANPIPVATDSPAREQLASATTPTARNEANSAPQATPAQERISAPLTASSS
jgi:hypothetical protein